MYTGNEYSFVCQLDFNNKEIIIKKEKEEQKFGGSWKRKVGVKRGLIFWEKISTHGDNPEEGKVDDVGEREEKTVGLMSLSR